MMPLQPEWKRRTRPTTGFSLIELIVILAILALASFLAVGVIARVKTKARRIACVNNLKVMGLEVRVSVNDENDPALGFHDTSLTNRMTAFYSGYRKAVKDHLRLRNVGPKRTDIFACPADTFYPNYLGGTTNPPYRYVRQSLHDQAFSDYSSYVFNGPEDKVRSLLAGGRIPPGNAASSSFRVNTSPSQTFLVSEASALVPWSWHEPAASRNALPYSGAMNYIGFGDGHVGFVPIYWNGRVSPDGQPAFAFEYDPPAGFPYQWRR